MPPAFARASTSGTPSIAWALVKFSQIFFMKKYIKNFTRQDHLRAAGLRLRDLAPAKRNKPVA